MYVYLLLLFRSFAHCSSQQQRQIGNAVPVPLAFALGKSIGAVLPSMWEKEDDDEDDDKQRELSPEIPIAFD